MAAPVVGQSCSPCSHVDRDRAFLSPDALRRLCVSLILAEQEKLLRMAGIEADKAAVLRNQNLSQAEIDAIHIDFENLGFDSISILELILSVNQFFGLYQTGIEDYLLIKRSIGDWVDLLTDHFANADIDLRMTFSTSGSSGTPKAISHPFGRMRTEVLATLQGPLAMLQPSCRILTLVPPHHIYGFLFTALLPSLSGNKVIDMHRSGPGSCLRIAQPGDVIIGTPLNWRHVSQLARRFGNGVHGVVSAGPTDSETWSVVAKSGLTSLTEVYGSTETLGIATRTSQNAAFLLMSHLRRKGEGILTSDYELPIQDRLEWVAPREFVLDGRLDNVVQVAGVNVSLKVVRERFLSVEGVQDAAIRFDGTRLKAFIQTSKAKELYRSLDLRVRSDLARQLPAAAMPQSIVFGPSLPRNALGKLCDWNSEGPPADAGGITWRNVIPGTAG